MWGVLNVRRFEREGHQLLIVRPWAKYNGLR